MSHQVPCKKISAKFDFKTFENADIPEWFENNDCTRQYFEIWKIFLKYVLDLKAKKVLEFGTRDGYSTRLFSDFLKFTGGHLTTVDLDKPKIADTSTMDNVTFIQSDILNLDWKEEVDILYIDDWHSPYHLFGELDRFSKYAKVVMIHDVMQEWQIKTGIMNGVIAWCQKEFIPFTIYPLNACGLAIIENKK